MLGKAFSYTQTKRKKNMRVEDRDYRQALTMQLIEVTKIKAQIMMS